MTGLPSHIFVVRHGNRLDAADKQWHLSSPTPYDPPLTYGGWQQARQAGNQIRNYLEQAKRDADTGRSATSPKKRYRIVIHSSPFLRCVQTSISLGAGISQAAPDSLLSPSDLIQPAPMPAAVSPRLTKTTSFRSSVLRLDPYLGEWLSPEYFDGITPPPSSSLMLGTANADLLKPQDYSSYTEFTPPSQLSRKNSLWSGLPEKPQSLATDGADEAETASATPEEDQQRRRREAESYMNPRPTYAISSNDKIPDGFVAHARDQCVSVDYQWDSMREPVNFGDGGSLGEEWPSMHERFRRGIRSMVNWYATAKSPEKLVSAVPPDQDPGRVSPESDVGDEDVETVLVIVSHGAGCNALIGAITHQPVLVDVGIASITMAVRKPGLDYEHMVREATMDTHDDKSSRDRKSLIPMHHMYDIQLSASTEHLRPNSSTSVSAMAPPAPANIWSGSTTTTRGRTSTVGGTTAVPSLGAFVYSDSTSSPGTRSSSVSAGGPSFSARREVPLSRRSSRPSITTLGLTSISGGSGNTPNSTSPTTAAPSPSLWAPTPSSLRFMDDGTGGRESLDDYGFPEFDHTGIEMSLPWDTHNDTRPMPRKSSGLKFSGTIKLSSDFDSITSTPVTEGTSGLWSQAPTST